MAQKHRKFPLPEGHAYAPGVHPRRHDGSQGMEGMWLAHAQTALRLRWGESVHSTGHMDVATQAALARIQVRLGADPTGYLDQPTWDAVFTHDPNEEPHPG